jgi:hypothetical protein
MRVCLMLADAIQGYQHLCSQRERTIISRHTFELRKLLHRLDTLDRTSKTRHAEALDDYQNMLQLREQAAARYAEISKWDKETNRLKTETNRPFSAAPSLEALPHTTIFPGNTVVPTSSATSRCLRLPQLSLKPRKNGLPPSGRRNFKHQPHHNVRLAFSPNLRVRLLTCRRDHLQRPSSTASTPPSLSRKPVSPKAVPLSQSLTTTTTITLFITITCPMTF